MQIHAGPHPQGHFILLKWIYYPRYPRQVSSLPACNSRNSVFTIQGFSPLNYSDFIVCTSLSSFFCSWWQHNSVQHWKAGGTILHVLPSDDKCILLMPWAKRLFQNTTICEYFLLQNSSSGYRVRDFMDRKKTAFLFSRLLRSSLLCGCFHNPLCNVAPGSLLFLLPLTQLLQLELDLLSAFSAAFVT